MWIWFLWTKQYTVYPGLALRDLIIQSFWTYDFPNFVSLSLTVWKREMMVCAGPHWESEVYIRRYISSVYLRRGKNILNLYAMEYALFYKPLNLNRIPGLQPYEAFLDYHVSLCVQYVSVFPCSHPSACRAPVLSLYHGRTIILICRPGLRSIANNYIQRTLFTFYRNLGKGRRDVHGACHRTRSFPIAGAENVTSVTATEATVKWRTSWEESMYIAYLQFLDERRVKYSLGGLAVWRKNFPSIRMGRCNAERSPSGVPCWEETRGKFSRWPAASKHLRAQCKAVLITLLKVLLKEWSISN